MNPADRLGLFNTVYISMYRKDLAAKPGLSDSAQGRDTGQNLHGADRIVF